MGGHYLAIDIGASSGRHIVSWRESGGVKTEEVYRFPNGVAEENGHLTWDVDALLSHVKAGIDAALERFPDMVSLSIDTWGVDYVLLRGDEEVRPCCAYRDNRTEAVIPAVHEKVPFLELYAHTGCQFQPFNTIYQLCDDLQKGRLEGVTDFLMIPEYLMWKLTGVKAREYTNATTTGLVNAKTGQFDLEPGRQLLQRGRRRVQPIPEEHHGHVDRQPPAGRAVPGQAFPGHRGRGGSQWFRRDGGRQRLLFPGPGKYEGRL